MALLRQISAVTGATSYNIYWSNSSSLTTANGTVISVSGTSYTHTGLTWTQPYYYLVTAVNSAHESVASSVLKASANIQWTNYTTTQGLGSNTVYGVWGSGSDLLASTTGGLSASNDGGATWVNYTTSNGLGGDSSRVVVVSGSTIYVGTPGGLSVGN